MRRPLLTATIFLPLALLMATPVLSDTRTITPVTVTEWKPVYAEVRTRDQVPARARIGGTITALDVTEGDMVSAGQRVALIEDSKLLFQVNGIDAQLDAYGSQLAQAQDDLTRGEALSERGVISTTRLQGLQTNVTVLEGQITALKADRQRVTQLIEEGEVLAPEAGMVLNVPVSRGGVIMAGEQLAIIGAGGTFLRLGVPERYADSLTEGDRIEISEGTGASEGKLAKVYPLIAAGRVTADVEVEGLSTRFVGRRVQLRLPVGTYEALLVPQGALSQSGGLDFVQVEIDGHHIERVVVPGTSRMIDGETYVEILSGLSAGEVVVSDHE